MCEFYSDKTFFNDFTFNDFTKTFVLPQTLHSIHGKTNEIWMSNTERESNMNTAKENNMVVKNNYICNWYDNGLHYVMPDIVDVNVIKNDSENSKTVTRVFFSDGTEEKAVLANGDMFCLETGIGICIAKKLLSMLGRNGNSLYNKIVHRATKIMKEKQERIAKAEKEQLDAEARYQKLVEKKKRRNDRRRQQEIEDTAQFLAEVERRKQEILNDNSKK